MRYAAAFISSRSQGSALRWYSEFRAANELASHVAWRLEPSEKSAPEPNSAASAYSVEVASLPAAATNREHLNSQFVKPAAGLVLVP